MMSNAEKLAEMFGLKLERVRRPAWPGWYWARQSPTAGQGDSCGWRPVYVTDYGNPHTGLVVTDFGDHERLQAPREVAAWEWGPRLEPPEDS